MVTVDAFATNDVQVRERKTPERENRIRWTLDVFKEMSVHEMFVR